MVVRSFPVGRPHVDPYFLLAAPYLSSLMVAAQIFIHVGHMDFVL